MKILRTDNFISERVKVKPITNAELDKVQKEFGKRPVSMNIVGPGDPLEKNDAVLVVCIRLDTDNLVSAKYGIYGKPRHDVYSVSTTFIEYSNGSGIDYDNFGHTFDYTYYNENNKRTYVHSIAKIFRPKKNAKIIEQKINEDFATFDKKLENNTDYECVYKNVELLEKYNLI